jgi:hypothetical protein
MKLITSLLIAFAALIATASAGPITGSESIAGVVSSADTGDITSANSVHFADFFDTGGLPAGTNTGDFLAAIPLGTLTGGPSNLSLPGGIGFDIADALWGDYLGNLTADVILPGARTIYFDGVFSPGPLFAGETPNDAQLIIAFTQAGDGGNAISASLSLSTALVPEPATATIVSGSLAIVGLGVGLLAWRRRPKCATL